MKHTLTITLLLVVLFFVAQVIGLGIIDGYLDKEETVVDGVVVTNITWQALPYDVERPAFEEKTSFLPIFLIILGATAVLLILMKFKMFRLWTFWYFISVWFCLMIAFYVFFGEQAAFLLAGAIAAIKVWWRNVILHNTTELLIYGGLAAVFVPFLNLFSMSILLLLISVYDAIAVWRTKHMVDMAEAQTKIKLFAGLFIPYGNKKAVLGGGDIGFPLFFGGVILKQFGWMSALIVTFCVTLALLILLLHSKKNTYYPAMPFLSAGCFVGLFLLWLL
ncbi:MAG: presenilin family intramembrane aspartyl protease [Nanoarchaeota archaeon]|mgnify:CR=1 FL=1